MYWIIWIGTILLCLVLQTTIFGNFLNIGWVKPDLLLIVIVFFAFRREQLQSGIFGFICGIAEDSLSGGMLGMNAFAKTIVGIATAIIKQTYAEKFISIMLSLFLFTIIHEILILILKSIFASIAPDLLFIAQTILIESIYNMVLGGILFLLFNKMNR
ncbi:MAG: rod shape-determining protein MreD [bacterium]|nr:rod shape-determining protein MreD [bacterium]